MPELKPHIYIIIIIKKTYSAQKDEFPKDTNELARRCEKRTKEKARQQAQEHLDGPWEGKELHRKHPKSLKDADVDLHRTKQWLTSNGLKTVTEIERKNGKGFTERIIEEWIINIRTNHSQHSV